VIVHGEIPRPSLYRAIPDGLDEIILKALARDPADRFQSADEMRFALEQFAIRNHLRSSPSSLAEYLKQIVGERIEPWFADDDEPEIEITTGPSDLVSVEIPMNRSGVARSSPSLDRPRSRGWIAIGVAALLIVIGAGALFATRSPKQSPPSEARGVLAPHRAAEIPPPKSPVVATPEPAPVAPEPAAAPVVAPVAPEAVPEAVPEAAPERPAPKKQPKPRRPAKRQDTKRSEPVEWNPNTLFPDR
jgi:serine/threonine protein kinase